MRIFIFFIFSFFSVSGCSDGDYGSDYDDRFGNEGSFNINKVGDKDKSQSLFKQRGSYKESNCQFIVYDNDYPDRNPWQSKIESIQVKYFIESPDDKSSEQLLALAATKEVGLKDEFKSAIFYLIEDSGSHVSKQDMIVLSSDPEIISYNPDSASKISVKKEGEVYLSFVSLYDVHNYADSQSYRDRTPVCKVKVVKGKSKHGFFQTNEKIEEFYKSKVEFLKKVSSVQLCGEKGRELNTEFTSEEVKDRAKDNGYTSGVFSDSLDSKKSNAKLFKIGEPVVFESRFTVSAGETKKISPGKNIKDLEFLAISSDEKVVNSKNGFYYFGSPLQAAGAGEAYVGVFSINHPDIEPMICKVVVKEDSGFAFGDKHHEAKLNIARNIKQLEKEKDFGDKNDNCSFLAYGLFRYIDAHDYGDAVENKVAFQNSLYVNMMLNSFHVGKEISDNSFKRIFKFERYEDNWSSSEGSFFPIVMSSNPEILTIKNTPFINNDGKIVFMEYKISIKKTGSLTLNFYDTRLDRDRAESAVCEIKIHASSKEKINSSLSSKKKLSENIHSPTSPPDIFGMNNTNSLSWTFNPDQEFGISSKAYFGNGYLNTGKKLKLGDMILVESTDGNIKILHSSNEGVLRSLAGLYVTPALFEVIGYGEANLVAMTSKGNNETAYQHFTVRKSSDHSSVSEKPIKVFKEYLKNKKGVKEKNCYRDFEELNVDMARDMDSMTKQSPDSYYVIAPFKATKNYMHDDMRDIVNVLVVINNSGYPDISYRFIRNYSNNYLNKKEKLIWVSSDESLLLPDKITSTGTYFGLPTKKASVYLGLVKYGGSTQVVSVCKIDIDK